MKSIKYLVLLFSLSPLFFACSDEDHITIDSLQVFGDEFYYGQTVNVAMSAHTTDPDHTTYHWECEAGTLLNLDGYVLNQWKAPRKSGRYLISCTVSCNGEKKTRTAEIFVNGFFFQRFESGEGTNSLPTGWAQDYSAPQIRNHRLELQVNNNAYDHGIARYALGQSNMYPPFSLKADVGIVGETSASVNNFTPKYPNSDNTNPNSFASRYPLADNYCAVGLTGRTLASDTVTHFVKELRLDFYPEADHTQPTLTYLRMGGTPGNAADSVTINKAAFDGILRINWVRKANISQGLVQIDSWYSIPFKASELVYGIETPRTIGLSVDENYIVDVHVNGVKIKSFAELQTWRQGIVNGAGKISALFAADAFRYYYPANTRVFLDNVIAYLEADYGGL